MMRDYDRFASLFTPDGAVRIPDISAELARREEDLRRDRVDAGSLRVLRANQDRRAGHQAAAARARATSPPATAASAVPAGDRFDLRQPQRPADCNTAVPVPSVACSPARPGGCWPWQPASDTTRPPRQRTSPASSPTTDHQLQRIDHLDGRSL